MARQARLKVTDQLFWIQGTSRRGRVLFSSDQDRRDFLSALLVVSKSRRWTLWSWVLLTSRYHLLVHGDTDSVCAAARDLNAAFSRARGAGPLFSGRFGAIVVDTEAYLAPLAAWMFQRPVAEGLANDPARWRWSAYPDLARMRKSVLPLDRRAMLAQLGGDRTGLDRLRLAVSQAAGETWNPLDHVTGQLALGSREFLERLRMETRVSPAPGVPASRVIAAVASEWKLDPRAISEGRGGEARIAAAVLLRESGLTLAATGAQLGIGESAVSRLLSSARGEAVSESGQQRIHRLRVQLGLRTSVDRQIMGAGNE